METRWLDAQQRAAWIRLAAVVELLPGVLDSQLRRDAGLTHFEYWVLSMLSEAPERTLRMTELADAPMPRCPGCPTSWRGSRPATWSSDSPAHRTGAPPTPD